MLSTTNYEDLFIAQKVRLNGNEFLPVEKRMALKAEDFCRHRVDGGFYCTLPRGHEGRKHVAHYSDARIAHEW